MAKSYHDMTIAELQAERGIIDAILMRRVCGDPRIGVYIGPGHSCSICGAAFVTAEARAAHEKQTHGMQFATEVIS